MYSCGSLAPKMGRGGGGCSDCRFRRPPQPWEKADGCIYLMGTLANVTSLQQEITSLLPHMGAACRHKHYTSHVILLETMCKILPLIAKTVGKRAFKQHLTPFIDPIFYSLVSIVCRLR